MLYTEVKENQKGEKTISVNDIVPSKIIISIHNSIYNRITDSTESNHIEANWIELNRIFQLDGTYNNHLVQLPDYFTADQKLKQITKGLLNTDRQLHLQIEFVKILPGK